MLGAIVIRELPTYLRWLDGGLNEGEGKEIGGLERGKRRRVMEKGPEREKFSCHLLGFQGGQMESHR
jgi:hypothetical protein